MGASNSTGTDRCSKPNPIVETQQGGVGVIIHYFSFNYTFYANVYLVHGTSHISVINPAFTILFKLPPGTKY